MIIPEPVLRVAIVLFVIIILIATGYFLQWLEKGK